MVVNLNSPVLTYQDSSYIRSPVAIIRDSGCTFNYNISGEQTTTTVVGDKDKEGDMNATYIGT